MLDQKVIICPLFTPFTHHLKQSYLDDENENKMPQQISYPQTAGLLTGRFQRINVMQVSSARNRCLKTHTIQVSVPKNAIFTILNSHVSRLQKIPEQPQRQCLKYRHTFLETEVRNAAYRQRQCCKYLHIFLEAKTRNAAYRRHVNRIWVRHSEI